RARQPLAICALDLRDRLCPGLETEALVSAFALSGIASAGSALWDGSYNKATLLGDESGRFDRSCSGDSNVEASERTRDSDPGSRYFVLRDCRLDSLPRTLDCAFGPLAALDPRRIDQRPLAPRGLQPARFLVAARRRFLDCARDRPPPWASSHRADLRRLGRPP